ncbi:hypothetical protein Glove_485g24 [Diversispora epigaea]|uniref:Peroxisomal membrane protein PEX13 n=1 Tax=Diversispora epigaea TaxID=1348612 RepID=A0A397GMV3_9GLOM|nr:hypothetical protein Glove_485g24 [Diversispora epigaea]
MQSPLKPWERNQNVTNTTTTRTGIPTTTQTPLSTNPGPETAPAVPARPMSSGFTNRSYGSDSGYGTAGYNTTGYNTTGYNATGYNATGYNSGYSPYSSYGSYGGGFGTPYNRYSSYSSPYSRYGSYGSYGGGGYGSPYNRFGFGGRMGPGGPPGPEEMSLTQRMEASTAAGFHMIESIVNAFGGFAQMLESTFFATHSSFMAMVGVVEQFGNLRNYLGQVLSIFALIRWLRHLFYRITGKKAPVNPNELNPIQFEQFQERKKYSRRPLVLFILAVFGIPYLMHKLIQIISRRQQQQIDGIPLDDNISNMIIPEKIDGNTLSHIEFCRALYDFKGESSVELTLKRGDIIAILKKTGPFGQPSQWWRGRLRNGKNGLFPSNYVEIINKGEDNSEGNNEIKKGFPASNDNNNKLNENKQDLNIEEFEGK